jgi:hypothetical protein
MEPRGALAAPSMTATTVMKREISRRYGKNVVCP